MKGTEKQVKWAEDIIDGAIKALEHAADLARLDNEKEYVFPSLLLRQLSV